MLYKWASEHAIIFDLFNAACGKGSWNPKHRAHPETVFINSQLSRMGKTANPQTIKLQQALKMPYMGWGGDEEVVEENR